MTLTVVLSRCAELSSKPELTRDDWSELEHIIRTQPWAAVRAITVIQRRFEASDEYRFIAGISVAEALFFAMRDPSYPTLLCNPAMLVLQSQLFGTDINAVASTNRSLIDAFFSKYSLVDLNTAINRSIAGSAHSCSNVLCLPAVQPGT